MKALFVHDHRFYTGAFGVLTEGQYEASLWARYLDHFDRLTVIGRFGGEVDEKQASGLFQSSRPGVTFDLYPSLSSIRGQLMSRPGARRGLAQQVKSADAVIARLPSELGLLCVSLARRFGKPFAVEVVDCPWDGYWNYGKVAGKLYAPVAMVRMRAAVRKAPFALYVTERFLQGRYPTRRAYTISCSNVELPEPPNNDRRLLSAGSTPVPLVIGLIGTLTTRQKGVHVLLKAAAMVREDVPEFRVRILGAGDAAAWKEEARRLGVADIFHFEGVLPAGRAVMHWLDEVDLYVHPSLKEGLPRAVIEAMSRGCPVIASRVGGIPELVDDQCLFRPGDAAELAGKLKVAMTEPTWRVTQGERNWKTAHRYTNEALKRRRYEFWREFRAFVSSGYKA